MTIDDLIIKWEKEAKCLESLRRVVTNAGFTAGVLSGFDSLTREIQKDLKQLKENEK